MIFANFVKYSLQSYKKMRKYFLLSEKTINFVAQIA